MRKKNAVKIFSFFVIATATLALSSCVGKVDEKSATSFDIPENTHVIIHCSSLTDTTVNLNPSPLSQIYYYDKSGGIIKSHEFKEEIVNDFIVQGRESVAFLLKNTTYIANNENVTVHEAKTVIDAVNFGPSQIGYIDEKDTYYSLLNVGRKSGSEYINIIRFASESITYDISIPSYLENITYDSATDRFVCVVSDIDSGDYTTFKYVFLKYDEQASQYFFDGNMHKIISTSSDSSNYMFRTSLAHKNMVYSAYIEDTQEYTLDTNPNKVRTNANLALSIYDLVNQTESKKMLKEDIALDELGYGVLSGSNNLPMEIVGDKLYVFTVEKEAFIIENDLTVDRIKMPYDFQGSLNLKSPTKGSYEDKENFFGSEISIEDDGTIYILNLSSSKQFTIHKLLSNSTYELVWEGEFPTNIHGKLFVNTFEVLN